MTITLSVLLLALLAVNPEVPSVANSGSGGQSLPVETQSTYLYPANVTLCWVFPEMHQTLYNDVDPGQADFHPPRMTIHLPENYAADKLYPMLVYIGGHHGGMGFPNPKIYKAFCKDTISVVLPLFKQTVEPLKQDDSNKWSRARIRQEDHQVLWTCYEQMLRKAYELVPNIDRNRTFMGGFSNGGHATAALLNRPDAANEIRKLITFFYFFEGGSDLQEFATLKNTPILFLQGGKHEKQWLAAAYERAIATGVPAQWHLMPNVGHEMPLNEVEFLYKWTLDPYGLDTHEKPAPAPSEQSPQ